MSKLQQSQYFQQFSAAIKAKGEVTGIETVLEGTNGRSRGISYEQTGHNRRCRTLAHAGPENIPDVSR
jgi:hypothetical protein